MTGFSRTDGCLGSFADRFVVTVGYEGASARLPPKVCGRCSDAIKSDVIKKSDGVTATTESRQVP